MGLVAQQNSIHVPVEIERAYQNGTRSRDGNPGPNYWQNTADYTIEVEVDPYNLTIEGSERVVYYNNSPDLLSTMNIRLLDNVFKRGALRGSRVNSTIITDGVNIKELVLNGKEIDLDSTNRVSYNGTNMLIGLEVPLEPGEEMEIQCKWTQEIPKNHDLNERAGAFDSTRIFLAYWYPQIGVYDDLFGWDMLEYNLLVEFYNNLANYNVTISVPEGYQVWATGTLENPKETFTAQTLEQFNRIGSSSEIVRVISADNLDMAYPTKKTAWRFKADEVSDFAFVLGTGYLWDATSLEVDGRNVLIQSVYPLEDSAACKDLISTHKKAIKHFSENIPGVPYPYPTFTTAIGTTLGGMEFPMMANNMGPDLLINIHEIYHTYLPMYVRINEKRWSWMDEGWAEHTTHLVMKRFFGEPAEPGNLFSANKGWMRHHLGSFSDLPLMTSSQFYTQENYGYLFYQLSATILSILHHHLGDDLFLKCYREFIERWAKKSPTPYDFFYTYEDVSDEDLSWLWQSWYFEFGKTDLGIGGVEDDHILISNLGTRPLPVILDIEYLDGTTRVVSKSAKIWDGADPVIKLPIENGDQIKHINLNEDIADVNVKDNYFPPISDRYPENDSYQGIEGIYATNRGSYTIELEKGVLLQRQWIWDPGEILVPVDGFTFRSLNDENLLYTFRQDESGIFESVDIEYTLYGYKWSAKKIK